MAVITVPKLNYFKQVKNTGNMYSGSVGTSPDKGCINTTVFDYKVYVNDDVLFAECKLTPPWYEEDPCITYFHEFELSEQGTVDAAAWISDKCDELLEKKNDNN